MQLKDLLPAALAILVAGIAISIGSEITTDVASGHNSNCSVAGFAECTSYNVAANATDGLGEMGSWFGTIGLVLAAAVVIGVIMAALYFRNK